MLWIIALVIGIAAGIYYAYEVGWSWAAYIGWPILFVILALLITMTVGCLCSVGIPVEKTELVDSINIVAMKDDIGIGGYYRHVESEGKYWVLTRTNKGLKMIDYDATQTYVQYTDEFPKVDTYKVIPKSCVRTFLFTKNWFETTEYIIYLPVTGKTTKEFVVDLQ